LSWAAGTSATGDPAASFERRFDGQVRDRWTLTWTSAIFYAFSIFRMARRCDGAYARLTIASTLDGASVAGCRGAPVDIQPAQQLVYGFPRLA